MEQVHIKAAFDQISSLFGDESHGVIIDGDEFGALDDVPSDSQTLLESLYGMAWFRSRVSGISELVQVKQDMASLPPGPDLFRRAIGMLEARGYEPGAAEALVAILTDRYAWARRLRTKEQDHDRHTALTSGRLVQEGALPDGHEP